MNNETLETYCSHDLSKLIKEKRFDNICRKYVLNNQEHFSFGRNSLTEHRIYIPTHTQISQWLFINHDIWISTYPDVTSQKDWCFTIFTSLKSNINYITRTDFKSPHEAIEQAIYYTLNNLI